VFCLVGYLGNVLGTKLIKLLKKKKSMTENAQDHVTILILKKMTEISEIIRIFYCFFVKYT
jgi:hypothetical protein